MRLLQLTLAITCITLLMSCEKPKEQYTLAYIDFSSSQDEKSMDNIISKIEEIYLNQPIDIPSRFVVRVIDKDYSVEALFDKRIEPFESERSFYRDSLKRIIERSKNELITSIEYYYKEVAPNKRSTRESCICNSLENAHYSLKNLDTNRYKTQVIVFSDMFEECGKKSSYLKQDFYMCKKNENFIKKIEELQEMVRNYNPEELLKDYVKPENLYFILTESDGYNERASRCLSGKEVKSIWEEFLKKMGYSKDNFNSYNGIKYSYDLPPQLLRK